MKLKIVYEVYNKFDNSVALETEFENQAIPRWIELNEPFNDINPADRPWGVTSKFMADSYVIKEK